jgi:hypothetical protein
MIIQLKQPNLEYSDLTAGQSYVVIGIEADDFRILNDHGRPFLYARDLFVVIDAREPSDWVVEVGDDGERYAYPPQLNIGGFFEDYFDAKPDAVSTFWQVVNQRLATASMAV